MEKQNTWVKPRHKYIFAFLRTLFRPYVRLKYHITPEPFPASEDRPYLIVFNHQTGFDQFFVGMAFEGPVYYVASEDLFSMGLLSKLLRWAVAQVRPMLASSR